MSANSTTQPTQSYVTRTHFEGTSSKFVVHASSPYSLSENDYNDVIERSLTNTERTFTELAKYPIVPLVTGPLRALYGCVEIVEAIFYALFKVVLNAPFNSIFYGKNAAMVSLNEAKRALIYIPHGFYNIGVGLLEMLHLRQDSAISRKLSWAYPSFQHPQPVPREELLMPTAAEQGAAFFEALHPDVSRFVMDIGRAHGEL